MPSVTLAAVYRELSRELSPLRFRPPVFCVYNPLEYARRPLEDYLARSGTGPKEVVLLGMNPGPFGMAQTGVPFGEVGLVRDWMKVRGAVDRPKPEHPKRPVSGFGCPRSEVSGARLWGFLKETFETPERLFSRFFVANYCPLLFMEESGKNLTPDKLPAAEKAPLEAACDRALRSVVEILRPRRVIGVGGFAAKRAALALHGLGVEVGEVLHPSPASPLANRGWRPGPRLSLTPGDCPSLKFSGGS